MIRLQDIQGARERIKKYTYLTPLERSMNLSKKGTNIYLKLENHQKTRSYKIRGALNKISSLKDSDLSKGLVAISSGNHGVAIGYAAKLLGVNKTTIYMPKTTPKTKVERLKNYGGEAVLVGKNYDEAYKKGQEIIKRQGSTYIDSCSDKMVIAGQGTIALEILEENPKIDTILVPIGGGGLITGIGIVAKAINPNIEIIGLQTQACPAMIAAFRDETFYESYPSKESICDALVGGVGKLPYKLGRKVIDNILAIEEKDIKKAVKYLALEEKIIAEPAGAIGVAAIRAMPQLFQGRNVAVVISGGNIDKELLLKLVNQ